VDKEWSDEEVFQEELALIKEAGGTMSDLKKKREQELQLLNAFKKSPSKETFSPLYQSMKPLIMRANHGNAFGSILPPAAHTAFAAQNFLDAIRTYNPSKGSFQNHVYSTVMQKGKRLNLHYQNIGYIPEARGTKYQEYNNTVNLLKEHLGREPSTLEIADDMGIPPKEVERLRKEVKPNYILNEAMSTMGPASAQSDKAMQVARDIQYNLIPKHRLVLEHTLGLNGVTPIVDKHGKPDIKRQAKVLGLTVADIRSARKTITREFEKNRGSLGASDLNSVFATDHGDADESD
jgi:hypothetical protein